MFFCSVLTEIWLYGQQCRFLIPSMTQSFRRTLSLMLHWTEHKLIFWLDAASDLKFLGGMWSIYFNFTQSIISHEMSEKFPETNWSEKEFDWLVWADSVKSCLLKKLTIERGNKWKEIAYTFDWEDALVTRKLALEKAFLPVIPLKKSYAK